MSLLCSSLETVNNLNQSIDQLHNITKQHCLSERDIIFVKAVIWNMDVSQERSCRWSSHCLVLHSRWQGGKDMAEHVTWNYCNVVIIKLYIGLATS